MTNSDYFCEIDLNKIADSYARRLARDLDELTLEKAKDELAKYDYVKVIRCHKCKHFKTTYYTAYDFEIDRPIYTCERENKQASVEPNGFCSYGEKVGN